MCPGFSRAFRGAFTTLLDIGGARPGGKRALVRHVSSTMNGNCMHQDFEEQAEAWPSSRAWHSELRLVQGNSAQGGER